MWNGDRADVARYRVPAGRMAVVLALVAALVGGCGAAAGVDGEHDDADVAFAAAMIPHHRQAITMAEMAVARATSPQVRELASQIDAEQVPEIVQMQMMLSTWGDDAAAPTVVADHHGLPGLNGTDGMSGMGDLPGMMTGTQMAQLAAASGPAFDHEFLELMIRHHEGAVAMAKTELSDGSDPDALTMAQNISDAQEAAIALMQRLLAAP